jgi:hypothetical protein
MESIHGGITRPSPVPFAVYAAHERRWFSSAEGKSACQYWRSYLDASPPLALAERSTNLGWQTGFRLDHDIHFPSDARRRLRRLARRHETTPFCILAAMFAVALARWSGCSAFPIRCIGDLRLADWLTDTVGLLICADIITYDRLHASNFAAAVDALTIEFENAVSLRLPTHRDGTGAGYAELHQQIAATINYVPDSTPIPEEGLPVEQIIQWSLNPITHDWPTPLPTIFFRIWEDSQHLSARLELNGRILEPADADALLNEFWTVYVDAERAGE